MSVKSTHGVSAAAKGFWLCVVFKGVHRALLRSAADHDSRLENLFFLLLFHQYLQLVCPRVSDPSSLAGVPLPTSTPPPGSLSDSSSSITKHAHSLCFK